MCGLFGFISSSGRPPNPRSLRLAAERASARGPHAHGWAIPGMPTHRALGELKPDTLPTSHTRILGHARLATSGCLDDLAATQPIGVDGHHLVHNGTAETLHADHPHAASDTAALALVYAAYRLGGRRPSDALAAVTARLTTPYALAVADSGGAMLVARVRLPLNVMYQQEGLYFSSGPLPHAEPIPEHKVVQLAAGPVPARTSASNR